MARPKRMIDPDAVYHVTSRGNNGRPHFDDDVDRRMFLRMLERAVERYDWLVRAFCLMTNHFHLVLQAPLGGASLSKGMQELNGGYSRTFNARHRGRDHLRRNRFHSEPIESESHLLEACRYVVLNPVRAGLCATPEAWQWSSYRATAGLGPSPGYLSAGWLVGLFSPDPARARERYRAFVADGTAVPPRAVVVESGAWRSPS